MDTITAQARGEEILPRKRMGKTLENRSGNGSCSALIAPGTRRIPAPKSITSRTSSIWRDILGFIPAYSVTFSFGIWLLGSLWLAKVSQPYLMHGLLAWHQCTVLTAPGRYGCLYWVEDAIHLRHLSAFPKEPSAPLVLAARIATSLKLLCFILGLVSTFVAALWLVKRVVGDLFVLHSGGAALLVALATGFIVYGVTRDFLSSAKGKGTESKG